MVYIRDIIEDHLKKNNLLRENQSGFTGGGRIEFNLIMLLCIMDKTIGDGGNRLLVMVALDFKKAFDSVERKEMGGSHDKI